MTSVKEAMKKALKDEGSTKVAAFNLMLKIPPIRKKVEITAEERQVIDQAVATRRQYLEDISGHMAGLVARLREIQMASLEEQSVRSGEFRELEEEMLIHLNSGEELLASAARQAYALAMVSTLPADKRLVIGTIKSNGNSRLPGLLDLKILEPVGDAKNVFTVKIYGDTYKVRGNRSFTAKLAEDLSEGAANAAKAAHEFYHSEVAALKAQATISVTELLVEKPGRVFMTVSDVKDGDRFLPGGALLAESDGKNVKVLKACGHFQRVMTEITEAGTFITINFLSRERLDLAKRLPNDKFRQARILHAVLRRGVAEAQKAK